jgi:type I restriction enzyme, S subunit
VQTVAPLSQLLKSALVFTDGDWVETKDQDPDGDVRLVQLADIGDGGFLDKSRRYLNSAAAKRLRCTFLEQGDVLVARMPDPLGRSCIFPGSDRPAVSAVDVCIVRADHEELDARWLVHCLNSPDSRRQILGQATGTTRMRISRSNLGKILIPVVPIIEQRRIADILDRADALRVKRRVAIAQLDALTRSTFLEMFGDPVSNPMGWPTTTLGELGTLDRGVSKHRPRNAPALLGGPHPLVQTGDVANSRGYIRAASGSYSDAGLRQSKKWRSGTLLITIAANIAKGGILTFDACFPDSVVGFQADDDATVEYVRVWLTLLQKSLEDRAPESAQKNINLAILRNLNIAAPPIFLQRTFAVRIAAANRVGGTQQKSVDALETLFQSLQSVAFRGEL